jgi:crotonobetainyl-CoA:carnitine CoA-transferase CaiB-like acyl-CoA transferase
MSAAGTLPLAGVRVVDMTTLAMGPLAAQILGDYGADVIKVESLAGDPFRQTLPSRSQGMGSVFLQFNRNKRSLAIDLKASGACDAFGRILSTADVLISNVRPSGMKRLGLDYAAVRALNPSLIYCVAYGFSEQGPYAGRPAADDSIQAMSGLVDLTARATGSYNYAASVIADKAVGLTLANAILAALIRRSRTGTGEYVETPMFESMVAFVMPEHMAGLTYLPANGPSGYGRIINAMRKPFATRDGHLCVLPYTTQQWRRFFRLIGRDDLADDAVLADPVARNARIAEFYEIIAQAMPARDTKDWTERLLEADIMFGDVFSPENLVEDPHLAALGMFTVVDHPTEGRIRLISPPTRAEPQAASIRLLPPLLGQHSIELLRGAGVPAQEIDRLIRSGAVLDAEETTGIDRR